MLSLQHRIEFSFKFSEGKLICNSSKVTEALDSHKKILKNRINKIRRVRQKKLQDWSTMQLLKLKWQSSIRGTCKWAWLFQQQQKS